MTMKIFTFGSILTLGIVSIVLFHSHMMWAIVLFLLSLIMLCIFIYDSLLGDIPVQKNFPLLYWFRRTLVSLGPYLRQYIFASDDSEKPFSRTIREWIYSSAGGQPNTIGFGSTEDMEKVGSMIILPATFTNLKTKESDQVGQSFSLWVGKHSNIKPVEMNSFINIGAMSWGGLSSRAISALNLGAQKAGIFHNTGEGGLSPYHKMGGSLIYQIGTAKFGIRNKEGNLDIALLKEVAANNAIKMFEIKLAQGAKPGKGGILPKEKITKEIAEIRKIPLGVDCYSPPRHKEFVDVNGLFDFIDLVRNTTEKPVGIKMVIGHTEEIELIAKKMSMEPGRGPDFITVDGGDGGTGASPLVLASYSGLPVKQAVACVDWALSQYGVRDKVVIFGSGKVATPIDVAALMALGANAVFVARGFMFALGCVQALKCHKNTCPSGIATSNPQLQKALNVEETSDKVARYANVLREETQLLAESCGYSSPLEITADDIMVTTSPGHLDYLSELHGVSAFEASNERKEALRKGTTVGRMRTNIDKTRK
ncbi:FMN-binding glutamate synthase family protein [Vibrio mediterranei]|uniref:FMN-binding glutamate synthase family protein n=1 Tax=Vibrio mediterranei TaxID=689 RepID=UPI001EFCBD7A|nr:FMN-binding glutamate synthase family protein [Vibrio mediterranei]MCG9661284.1 FMN-binding glutamate synthase family protein [Vibrio mediterranei]